MSRPHPNAVALLSRVAAVLSARGRAAKIEGTWLTVGKVVVATAFRGVVRVTPVLDGVDAAEMMPAYERTPTGNPAQAAEIALDIMVRLTLRASEAARGEAIRAAHACGGDCQAGGCPAYARDPETRHAA